MTLSETENVALTNDDRSCLFYFLNCMQSIDAAVTHTSII